MSKLTRIELYELMKSTGLVPLFSHSNIDIAKDLISACYKGGARVMEFTSRNENAPEVFEELALLVNREFPRNGLGGGFSNRWWLSIVLYSAGCRFCGNTGI